MTMGNELLRWRRWPLMGAFVRARARLFAIILGGILSALTLAAVLAPTLIQGARFGQIIERNLPKTRGTIYVGGGTWTWRAAWALWRGTPAPFVLTDVRVLDPEGVEVLRARQLSGQLEVKRNPLRIAVHGLHVVDAYWRFARMQRKSGIGFLAALTPAPTNKVGPGMGTRVPATPPSASAPASAPARESTPTFQIVSAQLDGLDAVFAFSDWALTLKDVHAGGALAYDGARGAPHVFLFDVANADVRGGGHVAVLRGPARFALPFRRAWLNRVATTADARDAIAIDASPVTTGRSRASFAGRFTGVYGNGGPQPRAGAGMSADIRVDEAADAVQEALVSVFQRDGQTNGSGSVGGGSATTATRTPLVTGQAAKLALNFSGAFSALIVA
ncbi:MAG: hypothetical protein H7X95_07390, partial [Deltaproteobacteria bacterium]|nr:hypothetical protein [Deltaproteobacteria bacterium]